MQTNSNLLKDFFNALPPHATGGVYLGDQYVNRATNPEEDAVAQIKQLIEWSDAKGGNSFLFSGLRGSGKTTELNRLVNELNTSDTTAAFYCDVSAYLNLNDPDISLAELLMTVLAGLADALKREFNQDILQDSIWERVKNTMNSNVQLQSKIKAGAIEANISLQENPEFKKQLREFTKDSSQFIQAARIFAKDLAPAIRKHTGKQELVLVVDSLERLSAPGGEEGKLFNTWKELFFANTEQLRFADFSIIYSAPPYLHAILPNVDIGFTASFSLPNFKVLQKPNALEDCVPNPEGISQIVAIVKKRFPDWQQAIEQNVLEHLAFMSGGNVRRLFELVRTTCMQLALGSTALPVVDEQDRAVKQAIAKAAEPLQWLTAKDLRWLRAFREHSKNPSSSIENQIEDLSTIIRLFDHSLVLNYKNGKVWYQVPPLVSNHALAAQASPAPPGA
ncbi:MAG: hypothetical protein RL497_296 [Pseudomonadota bacterium]|jgi:DNA polymerase III delta prime subunit